MKSITASLCISLGVYALLNTHYSYLSMILFAFGLYMICTYEFDLFTGKCGYTIDAVSYKTALRILAINLIVGYIIGYLFTNEAMVQYSQDVMAKWDWSLGYFIKSFFCGMIMFLAVETYKRGSLLGIFFGVPLFIICGFQHCIANGIIMGAAHSFSWVIVLAIIGNWIGAIIINILRK